MDGIAGPALLSLGITAVAVAIAAVPGVVLAALCGNSRSRWARGTLFGARLLLAMPTVIAGLLVYALLTQHGPLGSLRLLFTPTAIVLGEILLAFPAIVALGGAAVRSLDPRFADTLRSLRCGTALRVLLTLREARSGFAAAILAAFGRCVTELGVALLVGGSLAGLTRTLPAAIAMETARGDFDRALALGGVLLALAFGVNLAVWFLSDRERST